MFLQNQLLQRRRTRILCMLLALFVILNTIVCLVKAEGVSKGDIGVKKILGVSLDGAGDSYLNYTSPVSGDRFRVSLHRTNDDKVAYCLDRTKESDYGEYNWGYHIISRYSKEAANLQRNILLCGYPCNSVSKLQKMYGYTANKRSAEQATQMAIWVCNYMYDEAKSMNEAWRAHKPVNTGEYEAAELAKAILTRAISMLEQSLSVSSSFVKKDESDVTYAFQIETKSQYYPVRGAITGLPENAVVTADSSIEYEQDGSFVMNQVDGTARITVSFSRYVNAPDVVLKVKGTIPIPASSDGILYYENSDSKYQSVVVAKEVSPSYSEEEASFHYEADRRIRIRVRKQHGGSVPSGDASLEGAEYTIYDADGKEKEVLVIGSDHYAVSKPLLAGMYTVKETKSPKGYLLDEQVYQVNGKNPGGADITVIDVESKDLVIKGKVRLIKTLENPDSQSEMQIPAKGVVFTYYLNSDPSYKMDIVLDENGMGESEWMPYGTYTLEETSVPKGWKKVAKRTVTISENNKIHTYYMMDHLDASDCRIIKKDKETGRVIAFAGTRFQIRKKETGEIVSLNITYPKKIKIDEFVTNEEGYLMLPEKLQAGDYLLYELEAPEGYVKEEEPVAFSIPDGGQETVEVVMENMPQKCRLIVEKTGQAFEKTKELQWKDYRITVPVYEDFPLEKVTYSLKALEPVITCDGTVRMEKGKILETITDETGMAVFEDLYPGEYELTEVRAPEGFVPDSEPKKIHLRYEDSSILIREERMKYINSPQKASLVLEKCIQENPYLKLENPQEKVVFGLFTSEGICCRNGEEVIPENTLVDIFTVNKEGHGVSQIHTMLPYGRYYMRELETHPLCVLDQNKYEFEFIYQKEAGDVQDIPITKEPIVNKVASGNFSLHKEDAVTKEPLAGCKIAIKNDRGELVAEGITDETGDVTFEFLPVGSYTYYETTAPKGYVLDEQMRSFEITKQKEHICVVMKNDKEEEKPDASKEPSGSEKKNKKKASPVKTKDESNLAFWMMVALLSGSAIAVFFFVLRHKKH